VLNVCGFRVIYDTRRVRIIVVNKMRGLEYIARKNDCACVFMYGVCMCLGFSRLRRGILRGRGYS
jgi:hypothetical protein